MAENKEKVKLTPKETAIQVAKFVAFSMGAGIIQTVTFTLLNELAHLNYWVSYLTALILSVLYNFTVNRRYTFKSATNVPIAMLKIFGFYCVFTPVSTIIGEAVMRSTSWEFAEYIVLACTMATNMITEFLFCRFVVYKDSMNTNELAKEKQNATK